MPRMRSTATRVSGAIAAIAVAACAALYGAPAPAGATVSGITVYAAASLTDVLPAIDSGPRYSFGGSNALAAQIQLGAPADVFASANTTIPATLHAKGIVEQPVNFTRNTLVIVVPRSNPGGVSSIYDLTKPGVTIDVAASGVPVGSYTRQILAQMNL